MSKTSYICNCDVIHEDIVNDVKSKMQPKDDYIQLASLFKLFGDGTRVQILHALEQSEMCVCDLAVLLDVYKRQWQYFFTVLCIEAVAGYFVAVGKSGYIMDSSVTVFFGNCFGCPCTVSYTHLPPQ